MKTKTILTTIVLFSILATASLYGQQGKRSAKVPKQQRGVKSQTIQLFNGKNLDNWVFHLKDASVDPASVFTVNDGVISIKGDPFGYMRTKDIYADYKLHVEWRYPGEASNSGVFVHGQTPDAIWLKCVECQLKSGNAGDFVCMNGADMNERTDKTKIVVAKMAQSSEKPVGEWNTMEVTCKANTIEVSVNGVLQNKGTAVNINQGHICLQSEGKTIEFRNVFITRLNRSGK